MKSKFVTRILLIALLMNSFSYQVSADAPMFATYDCETREETIYSTDNWENISETSDYAGIDYSEYGVSPVQIIGDNNLIYIRDTTVAKYTRSSAYIDVVYPNGVKNFASAIMIGPSTALTAAHCVYNSSRGGYAKTVTITPAKNMSLSPYGTATVTKISIPKSYKSPSNIGADIAILNLNSAIGKKSGYMSCKVVAGSTLIDSYNSAIELYGYPESGHVTMDMDENGNDKITKKGEMWGMGGSATKVVGKIVQYDLDTIPGHSGAGLIYNGKYVIGVNTGYSKTDPTFNRGTRIDSEYLTWINGLIK